MSQLNDYDIELQAQLDRTFYFVSRGIHGKKNPMMEQTRDFRLVCIVYNVIVPTLKIVMGITYVNECPANSYIPIYMLVGGILQIIFMICMMFRRIKGVIALEYIGGIVLVIWSHIASITVLFEWEPDYYKTGRRYCNKVFYMFAFGVSLSEYITTVLVTLYLCIIASFEPF